MAITEFENRQDQLMFMTEESADIDALPRIDSPLILSPHNLKDIDALVILQFGLMLHPDGTFHSGRVHSPQRPVHTYPAATNGAFESGSGDDRRAAVNKAHAIGLLNRGYYYTIIPSGKDKVNIHGEHTPIDWSYAMYLDLVRHGYPDSNFIHDKFTSSSKNTHEENQVIFGLATRYGMRNIAVVIDERQLLRREVDKWLQEAKTPMPSESFLHNYMITIDFLSHEHHWVLYRDTDMMDALRKYIKGSNFLDDNQRNEQLLMIQLCEIIARDPRRFFTISPDVLKTLAYILYRNTASKWNHDIIRSHEIARLTPDIRIRSVLAEEIFALKPMPHRYMDRQMQERKSIQRTKLLNDGGAALMLLGGYYAPMKERLRILYEFIRSDGVRPNLV